MKSIIAFIMAVTLMFESGIMPAEKVANIEMEAEVSFADAFEAEIGEALSLKRESGFLEEMEERGVYYSFQNDMRVEKRVEDIVTQYNYNEYGKIVRETQGENIIEYVYQNEVGVLLSVTYNGIKYSAICDEDGSVIALNDVTGTTIVKYIYDKGIAEIETVNKFIEEDSFVGEKNKIRWNSLYFDDETSYYYSGGRFINSESGNFVDKIIGYESDFSIMRRDRISRMAEEVTNWADVLLNGTPNYGASIAAGSNWADGLSDVEVLARLIYAENPYKNKIDQRAITWIVLNRYYGDGFQDTLREVALAKNQFATSNNGSYDARNPVSGYQPWSDATWLACAILTADSKEDCAGLFGRPNGITDQVFFLSLDGFCDRCTDSSQGIVYNGNTLKDVVVVGDEYNAISHLVGATTLDQVRKCTENCSGLTIRPTLPNKEKFHNIFYNRQ